MKSKIIFVCLQPGETSPGYETLSLLGKSQLQEWKNHAMRHWQQTSILVFYGQNVSHASVNESEEVDGILVDGMFVDWQTAYRTASEAAEKWPDTPVILATHNTPPPGFSSERIVVCDGTKDVSAGLFGRTSEN